jgi:5-methylcytosine-specific restriction endonuclease McrA
MMNVQRLLELRSMPYPDYLKTDEWKEVRQEVLRRAKNRCQVCNADYSLHVHHRTYENRGDEDVSDLTVLCSDCHDVFHRAGKVEQNQDNPENKPWYTDAEFRQLIAR